MIQFTVYGKPLAKQADRSFYNRKTGQIIHYQDPKVRQWQTFVQLQALEYRPEKLFEGPLRLELDCYFTKPKRKKKALYPNVKPDVDNLCKAFMDAFEGILYKRDAEIVQLVLNKFYGDPPRSEVKILQLSQGED